MSTTTSYLKLTKPDMDDNITPTPYNDNFDIIDKEINNLKTDYVIASGIQNGWLYRRWNSGLAECWATVNAKYANDAVLQVTNVALPFTLQKGMYGSVATVVNGSNDEKLLDINAKVAPTQSTTAVSTINVIVHSKSRSFNSIKSLKVSVAITGRWK